MPNLLPLARSLRKNMTKQECKLWYDFLSDYPVHFIRQKIIGTFIIDFYCRKAKLAIELDGSQHYTEKNHNYDQLRTQFLEAQGIMVLRYSNLEVNRNFNGICTDIDRYVNLRIRHRRP